MDLDSRSPEHLDRAVSAEPSSTRPNPFDDGDISSRKRRRTSLSGSPATSLDTMDPIHESSSSTTLEGEPNAANCQPPPEDSRQPSPPRTPEPPTTESNPAAEPSSSKVTINLRNNPKLDTASSASASPSTSSKSAAHADSMKASVEAPDADPKPGSIQNPDTPQESSTSSGSPPIEIITVQSDDDMVSDHQSAGVSMVGEDLILMDPFREFPYTEADNTPIETIRRLIQYFSTQPAVEEAVVDALLQWIEQYLSYVRDVDQQTALDSCRLNRDFWQAFPEVIVALDCRKPHVLRTSALRDFVLDLYTGFAKITAWLVTFDHHTLQDLSTAGAGCGSPELLSPRSLQALHSLTRPRPKNDQSQEVDVLFSQLQVTQSVLEAFHVNQGGSIRSLHRLATGIITQVPAFPKLADSLTPVCQVAANIMAGVSYTSMSQSSSTTKQTFEVGHQLQNAVSDIFQFMIEKHVTQLNGESLTFGIQALTDILRLSLSTVHQRASDLLRQHRQSYPDLPARYTAEAVVCEWRFGILAKIIRSSQMQLRVMSVTTMCTDLVTCWKRYGDAGEEVHKVYLSHLTEYLLRTGLIEYILGPNCHPEIIVESANILGFLVITKMYREEHTDLLWQGITSSQDPRIAEALTRMITSIVNLFDYNGLLGLCSKLQTLPIEGFTREIRALWETLMCHLFNRANADQTTLTFHPFDLCLRLLREASICDAASQVAHPDMQQAVLQKLEGLFKAGPDPEGRQQLYQSCIDDISSKSNTTLGSLWFLYRAIDRAVIAEVHLLTEKHDLARLIVDELEHSIEVGRSAGVPAVLSGGLNKPRQVFISNILKLEPQTLDGELGARLWAMLVGPQSACLEDREAGWDILNDAKKSSFQNSYLRTCLSEYLSGLPPACFCAGMLDFVRSAILPRLNEMSDLVLDDQEMMAESGIEELWRLVLGAEDPQLVERSIRTLAIDIYIESRHIATNPLNRTRLIHLALVDRCLQQLKEAARKIKASSEGTMSGDDEPMVIVATDEQVQEQERIFTRTLRLLRFFLEAHQSKPLFATADLRTLISQVPSEVEGESAELKYQSFDGDSQTEVKPLSIGKRNTAASLLASLRQETGFDNYRIYYRGKAFQPTEHDICKSLEDLCVHDGLILVKREEDGLPPTTPIKPGASALEVEISAHFTEMWEYLSMEEMLAKEIYHFLIKLPTDGHVLKSINSNTVSYRDVFPPGQPYKSLYAVHALLQYTEAAFHGRLNVESDAGASPESTTEPVSHIEAVKTSISLIVQALSDEHTLDRASMSLRLELTSCLVHALVRLIDGLDAPRESLRVDGVQLPDPNRLVEFLASATAHPDNAPIGLIQESLTAMIRLSYLDTEFCGKLVKNPGLASILQELLLTDIRISVRGAAARTIEEGYITGQVYRASDAAESPADSLAQYFWAIIVGIIPQTATSPYQCDEVFRLAHSLFVKMLTRPHEQPDTTQLASMTSQLLLDHVSTENVGQIALSDAFARGLASLLQLCLQCNSAVARSDALPTNFAQDLFRKHLYPKQRSETEQAVQKVILNSDTRAKLVDIILNVVQHDARQFAELVQMTQGVVPYYPEEEDDPYLYELPYQFDRSKALRSSTGYVGLQNLSNTCYLNSLLTQLFMNTGFRRFIMSSRARDSGDSQALLFYTQKLFGYMQESYRRFIDPSNLVNSIKTYDDTAIDIHNQMDVDEFYNLLFDRWESQLPNSFERRKLRSFYGGRLVQQVKSKECEHISEREEPFSAIQCDIKGKSTLEESLQAYVDGEIMEGENKYKCSTCDKHVDAVKRACLKDIPDNMIFHLKRFDFNLRTLQRNKINDYFSFPSRINLRPYTIQHLSQPGDGGEDDIFELVGVLVHSGTAESGHYYSYIRERPAYGDRQSWVEFNDDMVSSWDPAMMESSTFGGPDHRPPYETNGVLYDKTYSAYMLFFQRASSLKLEQEAVNKLNIPMPLQVDIPESLKEHILDENTVLLRRHCIFDPSHNLLVSRLFNHAKTVYKRSFSIPGVNQENDGKNLTPVMCRNLLDRAMQVVISNFDQTVTRAKDFPDFPVVSRMISEAILELDQCALSFVDYFYKRPEALRALLQRNPDINVRTFVSKVFVWSLEKTSSALPDVYGPKAANHSSDDMSEDGQEAFDDTEPPIVEKAMHIFNHLWRYFHLHIRAWDEYFATILGFAAIGGLEVGYLLAGDYLAKLLRIIAADLAIEMAPNYTRMVHTIMRRNSNRGQQTSYVAIIVLIHRLMHQLETNLGVDAIVDDPTERLESKKPPFKWTSEEVELIHHGVDPNSASLFLEKLLVIDQAQEHTDGIIRLLVKASAPMDHCVTETLKRCIRGDISIQVMDPFLRAASVYIDSTQEIDSATKMIHHVSTQAQVLQNNEGVFFINFFKTALQVQQRPEDDFGMAVRSFTLQTMPRWVPWLLASPELATRMATTDFLGTYLFKPVSEVVQEEEEGEEGGEHEGGEHEEEEHEEEEHVTVMNALVRSTAKQVGVMCLKYLMDTHVRRRAPLKRTLANSFTDVLTQCFDIVNADAGREDEGDREFLMLQQEVVEPLRRLIVDVEDDVSEWEGSCGSSDNMDDVVEMSIQAMNELNDQG